MLLVLALSGLAAAFAAPIIFSSDDDDDDVVALDTETPEGGPPGSLLDFGGAEADVAGDDGTKPEAEVSDDDTDFALPAEPGVHALDGFDPETDTCVIEIDDIDTMIEAGIDEAGTPFVTARLPDGDLTVEFTGLAEVPTEAVTVLVPQDGGEEPLSLSLADVLDLGAFDDTAPQATTFVFDGGDEHPFSYLDDPLDDLGPMSPVQPSPGEVADDAADLLDALVPLGPGSGEAADLPTVPLETVLPAGPGGGDDADMPPVALVGANAVAPTPGDEAEDET